MSSFSAKLLCLDRPISDTSQKFLLGETGSEHMKLTALPNPGADFISSGADICLALEKTEGGSACLLVSWCLLK